MSIVSRAARFLASGSLAGGFAVGGIVGSCVAVSEIVLSLCFVLSQYLTIGRVAACLLLPQAGSIGGLRLSHDQGRLAPTPARR